MSWEIFGEASRELATSVAEGGYEPDIIMASAGDVPTLEALAATTILRKAMPNLKIRFVNVVRLATLLLLL